MADSCSTSKSLREQIIDDVRSIMISLEDSGSLVYASIPVEMVFVTIIGGDKNKGIAGEERVKLIKLSPTPKVRTKSEFKFDDKVVYKEGVVMVTKVPQSYTRKQLEGADYFLVGESAYQLVGGSLVSEPPHIFWEFALLRDQTNDKVSV